MTTRAKKTARVLVHKARLMASRVPNRVWMGVGVALFAVVGTILLVGSHAATPAASFEAEGGTSTSGATTTPDSGASAGSAVKFSAPVAGACAQTKRTITASDVSAQKNSGYPAGTQVYVPGGPDPWGGCFPARVIRAFRPVRH